MSFFCVSSQLMKALNLEGITIFSAQFVPWPLASAGRKRRATEYVETNFVVILIFLLYHNKQRVWNRVVHDRRSVYHCIFYQVSTEMSWLG